MKKMLLNLAACILVAHVFAQNGNTIDDAVEVDGIGTSMNLLDFDSADMSSIEMPCGSTADVFYRHDVSDGDNKVTLGMTTLGGSLGTDIHYQVLRANGGDLEDLEEISCTYYTVVLLAGGSFEVVIDDVDHNDDYFLRVFKPSGTLPFLTDLLNATAITMYSEFDSTLSLGDTDRNDIKMVTRDNSLNLINNNNYTSYDIFDLTGSLMASSKSKGALSTVDIGFLPRGLYVINLKGGKSQTALKFIRK